MITKEQILELAKEHLEHFSFDNGVECAWTDFAATKEQLIEFAEKIYEEGYDDGCYQATNSTEHTGLFGDPQ